MNTSAYLRKGYKGPPQCGGGAGIKTDGLVVVRVPVVVPASSSRVLEVGAGSAELQHILLWADRPIHVITGPPAINEVQTLAVNSPMPTTGGVVIKYAAGNLGTLAYNATAADAKAAYEAASWVGVGDVSCTGGPWPNTPIVVTFTGALAGANIPGATPPHIYTGLWDGGLVSVTETTNGGPGSPVDDLLLVTRVPLVWRAESGRPCPFTVASLDTITLDNPNTVAAQAVVTIAWR